MEGALKANGCLFEKCAALLQLGAAGGYRGGVYEMVGSTTGASVNRRAHGPCRSEYLVIIWLFCWLPIIEIMG